MSCALPPVALQIIPHLPVPDLVATAVEAERLGYASVWVSDEGFMTDPFIALGPMALATRSVGLGVVTNPYTRHPAMIAASLATLDQLSGGRALLCYVAGGSLVFDPIAQPRVRPVETVSDAITASRLLFSAEPVTWQGTQFQLKAAQLVVHPVHPIPIHVAARGPKMLGMAARQGDAIWLGLDDRGADDMQRIREAAGAHPIRIITSTHPPFGEAVAAALAEAMQQDGTADVAGNKPAAPPPQTMAAWAASVKAYLTAQPVDELLIVAWESQLDSMLAFVRDTMTCLRNLTIV